MNERLAWRLRFLAMSTTTVALMGLFGVALMGQEGTSRRDKSKRSSEARSQRKAPDPSDKSLFKRRLQKSDESKPSGKSQLGKPHPIRSKGGIRRPGWSQKSHEESETKGGVGRDRGLESQGIDRGIESTGRDRGLQSMGRDRGLQSLGRDRGLESIGLDRGLESMGRDRGLESLGINRGMESIGRDRGLESMGRDRGLESLGIDRGLESVGQNRGLVSTGQDRGLVSTGQDRGLLSTGGLEVTDQQALTMSVDSVESEPPLLSPFFQSIDVPSKAMAMDAVAALQELDFYRAENRLYALRNSTREAHDADCYYALSLIALGRFHNATLEIQEIFKRHKRPLAQALTIKDHLGSEVFEATASTVETFLNAYPKDQDANMASAFLEILRGKRSSAREILVSIPEYDPALEFLFFIKRADERESLDQETKKPLPLIDERSR